MTERWDAVVVGSGFGGSVAAARLAERLGRVLVLERGRPWPPGSFPRTPYELGDAFWDPSEGRHGLFDIRSFSGIHAVAASGLGGGSLIYANVLLRKPPETFADDAWPIGADDLAPHYTAVEEVLRPVRYPVEHEPYASTPKTVAFRRAAEHRGELIETPLAVAFAAGDAADPVPGAPLPDDPHNVHRLPRRTCRLVGECDVGCNDGAKQSLDHTYLSLAKRRGATLRTLCEAVGLVPDGDGGWYVTYRQHLAARRAVADPALLDPGEDAFRVVRARRVVLAAGTMGTNHLLLRTRSTVPGLSPRLGERFSSNADLLGFARDTARRLDMARGPVITSTLRSTAPGDRLIQVQDAGAPAVGEWLFEAFGAPAVVAAARRVLLRALLLRLRGRRDTSVGGQLGSLLGRAKASSNVLPLLGMGEDVAGGRFTLVDGELDLSWRETDSRPVIDAIEAQFRAVTRGLGGRYRGTPLAHLITVHALGGCAMAADATCGVVDPWGEAFGCPGLHVVDGAAMPGPVGPNPSLTIAAFADRAATRILEADAS